jgi:hypothetical protein
MSREYYIYVDPNTDPRGHANYIGDLMGQQCEAKPDSSDDESDESGSTSSKSKPNSSESESDSESEPESEESIRMKHLRIVIQNLKKKEEENQTNRSGLTGLTE